MHDDEVSVLGNVSWNSRAWSCTVEGENGPVPASGYHLDVLLREGDSWKECMSCYNVTPESTALGDGAPASFALTPGFCQCPNRADIWRFSP